MQSQTILYILPSLGWDTKERLAFKDMAQAKKNGYNVLLKVIPGSFCEQKAKELGFEHIDLKPHFINKFFKFHEHIPLHKILEDRPIHLIHCYDLKYLCSISIQLRRKSLISLIFTQDHTTEGPLRNFWYRPLISRIDSLIMLNRNLIQDVLGNLALPEKKIKYYGLGIKFEEGAAEEELPRQQIDLLAHKKFFLTGLYLSPALRSVELLIPCLSALRVLNDKLPALPTSKLILISPIDFHSLPIMNDLMKVISDYSLQEEVLFVETTDVIEVISKIDLWVTYTDAELIEDFSISALTHEVPVILVRNFCSKALLDEFDGVGETYKWMDSRELRSKWERILTAKKEYKEKTRLYKYFIEKEHSHHNYKRQLMALYQKLILRRSRLPRNRQ